MFGTNRARLGSIVAVAGTLLGLWAVTHNLADRIREVALATRGGTQRRHASDRAGRDGTGALRGVACRAAAPHRRRPRGRRDRRGGIPEDGLRRPRRGSVARGVPGRARQDGHASRGHPRGRRRLRRDTRRRAPAPQRASGCHANVEGVRWRGQERVGRARRRVRRSGAERRRLPRQRPQRPPRWRPSSSRWSRRVRPTGTVVRLRTDGTVAGVESSVMTGSPARLVLDLSGVSSSTAPAVTKVGSAAGPARSRRCAREEGARRARCAATPRRSISAASCPWRTASSSRSAVARWSSRRSRRRRAKRPRRSRAAPVSSATSPKPAPAKASVPAKAEPAAVASTGRTGGGRHQGGRGSQAGRDSGEARHAAARSDRSERRHDRRARRGRSARRQGIRRPPHLARLQGRRHRATCCA